jgi:hypothetical protein
MHSISGEGERAGEERTHADARVIRRLGLGSGSDLTEAVLQACVSNVLLSSVEPDSVGSVASTVSMGEREACHLCVLVDVSARESDLREGVCARACVRACVRVGGGSDERVGVKSECNSHLSSVKSFEMPTVVLAWS